MELDIEWKKGVLSRAVLKPKVTGTCTVRYGNKTVRLDVQAGVNVVLNRDLEAE